MQSFHPSLIVFDLDFTLWDCGGTWCDCLRPPFGKADGGVTDAAGRRVRLFPDVLGILDWCDQRQIPMALASRTEQPGWARELLSLLGIRERFVQSEIYPTTKLVHFESLREGLGIDYTKMLFFDDEARNIREVGTTGVRCIFVRDGMTRRILEEAIESGQ